MNAVLALHLRSYRTNRVLNGQAYAHRVAMAHRQEASAMIVFPRLRFWILAAGLWLGASSASFATVTCQQDSIPAITTGSRS
jgi:hypothetical protein